MIRWPPSSMGYIIGRGRNARETYPEPSSRSGGSSVVVGYDAVVEEIELSAGGFSPDNFIVRNVAGDPLEVDFPDFTLGNVLEVDFRFNGTDAVESSTLTICSTTVLISIDGGTTWYFLKPSCATEACDNHTGTGQFSMSSLTPIVIQDPMIVDIASVLTPVPVTAPPKVRVGYSFSQNVSTGERGSFTPSTTLKCSEIAISGVFQG